MNFYSERLADAYLNELHGGCDSRIELILSEIKEKQKQGILVASLYKRLGEVNLDYAKAWLGLDTSLKNLKIERLQMYLGSNMFDLLMKRCESDEKVLLRFVIQAIESLIPEAKKIDFNKLGLTPSKMSNNFIEIRDRLSNDRQWDLGMLFDDKLRRLLDFSFDGDWDAIDEFCTEAIKIQIPVDHDEMVESCVESL